MAARRKLTRDAVLGAALAVIDERGLEGCTMRAVAAALGVEAMSLYHHVDGKDALLDGVVERILREVQGDGGQAGDWREGLELFAAAFRGVMLRHPRAAPLLAGRALGAYAAAAGMLERGIATMQAAGFDRPTAVRAARTVARYVVGFTMAGAGPAPPPAAAPPGSALAEVLDQVAAGDSDGLFAFGLETILDGLEVRLRRA
ncbi:TetR/AcrR family transcriptional regulator C-terminal domain-containing protein [Miltoncostaea marina]|uniref:TetR/AcrR family transcriptional regulator C-terminal domain-containing protein n=1 Tax=Miltoncostaea marina TaxID=2843215 RepID=UPI001C3C6D9B|nr:TetR/AcrR family transcriptional regulator C-terminal domain-containing protein [Miltoncostaea marina]